MSHHILIRHGRDRAVLAEVETVGEHVRLDALRPHTGPLPEWGHIKGGLFPDMPALRRAVVAEMRGPVGDTLDRVLLSPVAYREWEAAAKRADLSKVPPGAEFPTERARPVSGGRLMIWVDLPGGGSVKFVVPRGQWAWREPEH